MARKTAQQVFDAAFADGRARSPEFRQGALDFLSAWVDGFLRKDCPFESGTAQADAWDAGQAKGRALALANTQAEAQSSQASPASPAPHMTPADALRLAINVLRDSAESRSMPSGLAIDSQAADLHAQAADVLNLSLQDLRDHE